MRLLHTADWHLGRVFHGQSLLEDQAELLEQFVALARDLRPDAVLIAGDVYDRSVPPSDAVKLLDDTLTRLVADAGIPVVAIAGNHDGPDRLSFGARLMAGSGLRVEGVPARVPTATLLGDRDGDVEIFALPYAEPAMMRSIVGDERAMPDHQAVLAAQMDAVRAQRDRRRRLVVLAHAFVAGGADSESERPLAVGGSASVDPAVFDGAHYVALGHLHRPQSVGRPAVRYSGSLMKYSFSEAAHSKSVSLVELDAAGGVRVEAIELSPRRDLRIVRGALAELLAAADSDPRREDFLLFQLTDAGALLDAMPRLRGAYPNGLAIERTVFSELRERGFARAADHRRVGLLELFEGFAEQVGGEPLDEASRRVVGELIDEIARAERGSSS